MSDTLRISATLYTTWLNCPAAARARIEGHYPPSTIHTFRGLLAHRIFARHLTHGPIPTDNYQQVARSEIGGSNLNYVIRDLGLKPSQVRIEIDRSQMVYDVFTTLPLHRHGYTGIEESFTVPLTPGVELVGRIDAITRTGQIIDWKTGNLDNAEAQLDFYLLAHTLAGHTEPGVTPSASAISIPSGEIVTTTYTARKAALLADHLGHLIADLTTPTPPAPRGGPWCRYCPLNQTCPEGARTLELIG